MYRVGTSAYLKLVFTGITPIKNVTLLAMRIDLLPDTLGSYQIIDQLSSTPLAIDAISDFNIDTSLQNYENEIWHEFYFHPDYFPSDLNSARVEFTYTCLVTYYSEEEIQQGVGPGRRSLVHRSFSMLDQTLRRRLITSEKDTYEVHQTLIVLPYQCDGNL